MLKGVDVSNWQEGLNISDLAIDFIIIKATEGNYFVDRCCDGFVQDAIKKGILWGFYHYANNNDPIEEAEFFVEHTRNYFNKGIPVLDIEDSKIYNWGSYSDKFTKRVHELTNVWPMIYCSAGFLQRFENYSVHENCGLWCAGYPQNYTSWTTYEFPYDVYPWSFAAIWQFTSNLQLSNCDMALDGNIAYMSRESWNKYANSTAQITPSKSISDVAYEVILGEWGNGSARKKKLTKAGYDYSTVQNYINELYSVANDVINGKYGNGKSRVNKLTKAGYDPNIVQYIVNSFLK